MRIDVISIFPELFGPFLGCSIVGRAIGGGLLEVNVHNLRDFTTDRHRTVDDSSYGGGPGMVMRPEPWFRALRRLTSQQESEAEVILLCPGGRTLDQRMLAELAGRDRLILLCGRYEGIDDRVRQRWATMEVSLGDFVTNGGELAAQVLIEGLARLLPGALGCAESAARDSFGPGLGGLLDHPHFTKPASFEGMDVPRVLTEGNHAQIELWRRRQSLRSTLRRRPDLLERAELSKQDRKLLEEIRAELQNPRD